jgi:2-keto-4-pentenoate hydratase
MTDQQIATASDLLFGHWAAGTVLDSLPLDLRPNSRADAYRVQAKFEARSGRPLFGWKIAATSVAGQRHIGIDGPIAGRVLAETVFPDGDVLPFEHNRMRVAEAEFAFRFGRDLAPRPHPYSQAEVFDAVSDLHLAIEVPDSRYDDFATVGVEQLIADNACAHQFVLGPVAPPVWRQLNLAEHAVVGRIDGRLERPGIGANVLGDPRFALTWLVNEVTGLGITLQANQIVTTGTCIVPLEIEAGDQVSADFGVLGTVCCRVANGSAARRWPRPAVSGASGASSAA